MHFFSELSRYADFVTWGKYVRKEELASVRQEEFTVGLRVNGRCYEISELDKTTGKGGYVKLIGQTLVVLID